MEDEAKIAERLRLEGQFKAGAGWFFWIAGLSLVNSIVAATGKEWGFVVGLGATQVIDSVARAAAPGGAGAAVALGFDILVLGVVVLFGVLCRKGYAWAFVVGMVLYALDGLIFLAVGDWFGLGFHALVLFFLFGGLSALRKLRALGPAPARDPAPQTAVTPDPIEPD